MHPVGRGLAREPPTVAPPRRRGSSPRTTRRTSVSTTESSSRGRTVTSRQAAVPLRLEVVVIPVTDADRARDFYTGLGWRLDADSRGPDGYHIVQVTPPGSNASVIFGHGVTAASPGAGGALMLVVDDLDAARDQLVAGGADVGEPFHDAAGGYGAGFHPGADHPAPGPDAPDRSYSPFAPFPDPPGDEGLPPGGK